MVTIDLSTPPPPAETVLDGLPRRVALTLPELLLAARLAGDAPLPFTPPREEAQADDGLSGRLGATRATREDEAYAAALASLHDPHETLRRRGLIGQDGSLDPGIAGAIGLLATPSLALDVDVCLGAHQAKAWHRYDQGAVATLASGDGIVFELAWFPASHWTAELGRVTAKPRDEDAAERASGVPAHVDLPYPLVDAVGEALRSGRGDLVTVLVGHQDHDVRVGREVVGQAVAATVVSALHTESRGRLRILAAEVAADHTTEVGVVSWVLLADGWHSITPRQEGEAARVTVRRVEPDQLATELAPVLARVTTGQEGSDG